MIPKKQKTNESNTTSSNMEQWYSLQRKATQGYSNVPTKAHKHTQGRNKGFVTSNGMFLDRKEAAKLAYEMGQISEPVDELKSEHIY